MGNRYAGQIKQIGAGIEQLAGREVTDCVMQGSESAASASNPETVALWVKDAMSRLDALVEPPVREQIMLHCGHHCAKVNSRPVKSAVARRSKFSSEAAFLDAEVKNPPRGFRFEREGAVLTQFYTPHSYGRGMRCYCSWMNKVPAAVTASPTYCQCSRGFVQKYWEAILGRSVRVDLGETAINGADECRFVTHL